MRFRTTAQALALAGLATLVGAACGGNGDTHDPPPGDCTPVPSGEALIDQDALKFEPPSLCVRAGQEMLFTNSETAIHTVTIEGKNESGTMKKGDEFRWTPPQAGAYDITCEFHPQMKARITVVQ